LCIVAAVLTKGPVGFFPLVLPIAWLLLPEGRPAWRGIVAQSVLQWTTIAVCAWLLWTSGMARASLTDYANQQVIAALAGAREVSGSSVAILRALMQGVALPMTGVGVLAIVASGRVVVPRPAARRRALLFLVVGLSGTLPILASAKQAGHYLVPAVPLYAIAVALIAGPTVAATVQRSGRRQWRVAINIVTTLVTLGTVCACFSPAIGRDRERLADLDAMASTVPRTRTVGLCPESNDDWGLHAWFQRRFQVSLDAGEGRRREWFLRTVRGPGGCVPAECAAATDPRRQLVLMKCRRSD
jgi:4-amino-4-deoxy-L-arabinose transferase-like glycosyltransferase